MTKLFYAMVAMFAFAVIVHFTPQAKAASVATMPNKGGGYIVLTDEVCVINGKKFHNAGRAYTFHASGTVLEGCFGSMDIEGVVKIIWLDGDESIYPISNFTPVGKAKPKERLIPT